MRSCENCGWLEINPSGAMFCGYYDERTWENESCLAWKDKDEPKTKADRIRSMSDEELAEFLRPVKCVDCHLLDCGVEEMNFKKTCEERILDWLREEVSE